jgi:heme exporter protein A
MLELVNLSCQRGERRLFSNLSMAVAPGALVAVRGKNGSGKTSLLRMLCGLFLPEQGTVLWHGENINALKERYVAQLLYVGHLNGLKDDMTPVENLRYAALLGGEQATEASARDALSAIGLDARIHALPTRALSQGQKRRVALARVWLSTRPLWILDEPFASLDEPATQLLTRRFQTHVESGGMVVVATHDEVKLAPDSVQQMRLTG